MMELLTTTHNTLTSLIAIIICVIPIFYHWYYKAKGLKNEKLKLANSILGKLKGFRATRKQIALSCLTGKMNSKNELTFFKKEFKYQADKIIEYAKYSNFINITKEGRLQFYHGKLTYLALYFFAAVGLIYFYLGFYCSYDLIHSLNPGGISTAELWMRTLTSFLASTMVLIVILKLSLAISYWRSFPSELIEDISFIFSPSWFLEKFKLIFITIRRA